MSSPAVERRIGVRRPRSLSPSNQIHREKRQRTSRQASFSPPLLVNRPNSASSSAASIGQYYGIGDEDTLSNLFASYPQTFSTFPLPHGSQGLHEPAWDLRFDYEIYLLNEFPSGRTRLQRVRVPIPGPEIDPPPFSSPPEPAQRPSTPTRAEFESAMKIVRQVVGEGQSLTIDLARSYERVRAWRERWGWSPLSSDAYESPPPYSPPRKSPTQILQVSPRAESPESLSFQQISSPFPGPIPNPPIPGDPAPSAEALFDLVNLFAKENGFGIVRRNAYSYKGRRIRYSLQCDRFGQPGASKGAGLRQRKSRKCGCKWMKWAKKRKSSSSPDASDWEDSAPQTQAELSVTDKQLVHALTGDEIPHTYRGVLMMWKRVLFAETEEAHEKAWRDLCKKFDDQRVILRYLHGTYLPVRAQWARCFLRKHRNFGIRVTSGTEASNNNIKSYLLNGMSHLYRLVEAMQDMMKDQERDFKDACAQDEVLTAREYLGSSGDYLGDLPTVISSKALGLINKQYRIAHMMSIHIGDYEIHHSKIHTDGFLILGLPLFYVADPRIPRSLCLREWPLAGAAKTSVN
ncbi:PKS-NRPS hybrid synthetase [Fusarium oxysporum f. sp. raphani]|uniref:PKS-NRPS hybrid synthetase n=1 Tax=Fusarium oxysporum f. sp. raphani TaxID=96318 RepID=A0A8J5PLT1_FUSOX|nr:PKS-NRPS hybrid synthetase [Fusarium oxysporum f. sp. raphani]